MRQLSVINKQSFKYFVVVLSVMLFPLAGLQAQEINFSKYSDAGIYLTVIEDLEFGQLVATEDLASINLGGTGMAVLRIEGVAYLDVEVDVIPDEHLINENEETLDLLNVTAYYANLGQEETGHAKMFNSMWARFPIYDRKDGPPRPPPTPEYEGYEPPVETAYLFITGDLDLSGAPGSGYYTGEITVEVRYAD